VNYTSPRDPVAASVIRSSGADAVRALLWKLHDLVETQITQDPSSVAQSLPAAARRPDFFEIIVRMFGTADGDPKPADEIAVAFSLTVPEVREVADWTIDQLRYIVLHDDDDVEHALRDFIESAGTKASHGRPAKATEFFTNADGWTGQRCLTCNKPLPYPGKGRPRTTCSSRCRQRQYRVRNGAGALKEAVYTEPYHLLRNTDRPRTYWAPRKLREVYGSFDEANADFRQKVAALQTTVRKVSFARAAGQQQFEVWEAGWYLAAILRERQLPLPDAGGSNRAALVTLARIVDELGRLSAADDEYGRSLWQNSTEPKAVKALATFTRIATGIVGLLDDLSRAGGSRKAGLSRDTDDSAPAS
jgi:hypothetical protein